MNSKTDLPRLQAHEVQDVVEVLRGLSERAHAHNDRVLWMVLHCAAESIADGLEMHADLAGLNDD